MPAPFSSAILSDMRYASRRRHRGFSLVEILFSLGLLALMMALTAINLKPAQTAAQSKALATQVATELKLARQSAISSHVPVALVIPSAAGTVPHSQSIYIASGESQGHAARVVDYSKDYQRAVIFSGTWPLANGSATISPPTFGARKTLVYPSNWLTTEMKHDYCLIFTPDGNVQSNGLPFFNGAYHLVSCSGLRYAPGSAPSGTAPTSPGPSYFSPTQIAQPYTISISPLGQVSIDSGLAGQNGSVAITNSDITLSTPPAAAPTLAALPPSNPLGTSVTLTPDPPSTPPSGINTTVTPDGRVSLEVYATDSSSRDVYVQWRAAAVGGGDGGNFSFPRPERMSWDGRNQRWTSWWEWAPPASATPGQVFALNCTLGDGTVATVMPQSGLTFQSIHSIPIYYVDYNGPGPSLRLCRIESDGSGKTVLGTWSNWSAFQVVSLSRDLTKLTLSGSSLISIVDVKSGATVGTIYPTGGTFCNYAAVSPLGNKIVYAECTRNASNWAVVSRVVVSNIDGTNPIYFSHTGTDRFSLYEPYGWSPNQSQVVVRGTTTMPAAILDVATNSETPLNTGGRIPTQIHWSSDNWIYFHTNYGAAVGGARGSGAMYRVRPDGTNLTNIPLPAAMTCMDSFTVSPTGSQLAIYDTSLHLWTLNADGTGAGIITSIPNPGGILTSLSWGN